jgi:hypothetical protein
MFLAVWLLMAAVFTAASRRVKSYPSSWPYDVVFGLVAGLAAAGFGYMLVLLLLS